MTKPQSIFITNARIFDGERLLDERSLTIEGERILELGRPAPAGADVVDARGGTLLPGLIDAHTHADLESRRMALTFGVTTVCIMQGYWTKQQKQAAEQRRDLADALSSLMALSAPLGHPHEIMPKGVAPKIPEGIDPSEFIKFASTPDEARRIIAKRVEQGADYIKVMIEDGAVFGKPGTPDLTDDVLTFACSEAHRVGKMVVAHTMSVKATTRAVAAGVDGLMHVFVDQPHTPELIAAIAASGAFMCPTVVAGASTIGDSDAGEFAKDERVRARLTDEWYAAMSRHIATCHRGKTQYLLEAVKALHDAGVDIVAGADASIPGIGGMAHGASLHHELQLLVRAGLTPIEALRAATSVPARRFGMSDRGRIFPGGRADLVLVRGNPTENIADTLSTEAVWRQGVRLQHRHPERRCNQELGGDLPRKGYR
jgi:imidazolonepropionase-like amidohydrolase